MHDHIAFVVKDGVLQIFVNGEVMTNGAFEFYLERKDNEKDASDLPVNW